MFGALLRDRQRVLGPFHPDVLTIRRQLAFYTGSAGDPAAARDMFLKLLRDIGPYQMDTLITRHHLARFTGEAGDAAAARDMFAALVPRMERVYGADHQRTVAARRQLARFTKTRSWSPRRRRAGRGCSGQRARPPSALGGQWTRLGRRIGSQHRRPAGTQRSARTTRTP
jgi:hypothetical protein